MLFFVFVVVAVVLVVKPIPKTTTTVAPAFAPAFALTAALLSRLFANGRLRRAKTGSMITNGALFLLWVCLAPLFVTRCGMLDLIQEENSSANSASANS